MIQIAVFLFLHTIIPLQQTYKANRSDDKQQLKLWAIYWSLYACIKSLQWFIPFLANTPFEFLFTLILIWLYHENYKGALFFEEFVGGFIGSNQALAGNVNLISEKLAFFPLFEKSPVIEKTKAE